MWTRFWGALSSLSFVALLNAILCLSPAGAAEPLDLSTVSNPDRAALEQGLVFHSSIPVNLRKVIIDDLVWLHDFGPLKNSKFLAELIGLDEPLTGSILVAWMLDRLAIVGDASWCVGNDHAVVSNLRPERGILIFRSPSNLSQDCRSVDPMMLAEAFGALVAGRSPTSRTLWRKAERGEVDAFLLNDKLFIAREITRENRLLGRVDSPPVMLINAQKYFSELAAGLPTQLAAIHRLTTLMHEAEHFSVGHVRCTSGDWAGKKQTLAGWSIGPNMYCDAGFPGAYSVHSSFQRTMTESLNLQFSGAQLAVLKKEERSGLRQIRIRLKNDYVVRATPELRGTAGITGETFTSFPPKIAFDAELERLRLEAANCQNTQCRSEHENHRREVQSMIALLSELERRGEFTTSWTSPALKNTGRPNLNPAQTNAWIRSVRSAAAQGYNVSLKWATPCTHFKNGCPP